MDIITRNYKGAAAYDQIIADLTPARPWHSIERITDESGTETGCIFRIDTQKFLRIDASSDVAMRPSISYGIGSHSGSAFGDSKSHYLNATIAYNAHTLLLSGSTSASPSENGAPYAYDMMLIGDGTNLITGEQEPLIAMMNYYTGSQDLGCALVSNDLADRGLIVNYIMRYDNIVWSSAFTSLLHICTRSSQCMFDHAFIPYHSQFLSPEVNADFTLAGIPYHQFGFIVLDDLP